MATREPGRDPEGKVNTRRVRRAHCPRPFRNDLAMSEIRRVARLLNCGPKRAEILVSKAAGEMLMQALGRL